MNRSDALSRRRVVTLGATSVVAFTQWSGPLRPHFAYGALDKPAYVQAHAMHLANHFSKFQQES